MMMSSASLRLAKTLLKNHRSRAKIPVISRCSCSPAALSSGFHKFDSSHHRDISIRHWSDKTKKKTKTKKKKKGNLGNASASAGRVTMYQPRNIKKGAVKMCSGCGSQILGGGSAQRIKGGGGKRAPENDDDNNDPLAIMTKTQEKKTRYFDVTDTQGSSILCDRCKALQSQEQQGSYDQKNNNNNNNNNNTTFNPGIWKAYDAIRDVEPEVFLNQLKFVVNRRRFGMGIVVLDATDSEHTAVRNLRNAVGTIPLFAVWNKVDLLPRFSHIDKNNMDRSLQKSGLRFAMGSFAVSAKHKYGLVDLTEQLLQNLGGRDVFVMGAANVGKSTLVKSLAELISESIYMKGRGKRVGRRREQTSSLQVIGSHLPGTTLQAVRIPCFSSDRHALWDTPGILNPRAVQYKLFPAHLMEPLTRPERIEIPTKEGGGVGSLTPGYSLLIESTWMSRDVDIGIDKDRQRFGQTTGKNNKKECVLARIDLIGIDSIDTYGQQRHHRSVGVRGFLHPSLRVRFVQTSEAPDRATIPTSHIRRIQQKIKEATGQSETGLKDSYGLPLKAFVTHDRPNGEMRPGHKELVKRTGKYTMDVVFASLGWIGLINDTCFTIVPHCVEGSIFSKRKSIYPPNLIQAEPSSFMEEDSLEDDNRKKRIRTAAKAGRHSKPAKRKTWVEEEDDFFEW